MRECDLCGLVGAPDRRAEEDRSHQRCSRTPGNTFLARDEEEEERSSIATLNAILQVLGVPEKNLMLMNYGDGELTSYPTAQVDLFVLSIPFFIILLILGQQVKAAFIATIRKFRPHIVMSWWPYPRFEMKPSDGWEDLGFHPDHQVTLLSRRFVDAGVLHSLLTLIVVVWKWIGSR